MTSRTPESHQRWRRRLPRLPGCLVRAWAVVVGGTIGPVLLAQTAAPELPGEIALQPVQVARQVLSANWEVVPSPPFVKEPPALSGQALRRALRVPGATNSEVGIIWDPKGRKLYVDENRNLDLSDDAAGVYVCARPSAQQHLFTNVFLPVPGARGLTGHRSDLTLSTDAGGAMVWAWAESRLIWEAKLDYSGRSWQLALIDRLPSATHAEEGYLLLRPWDLRTNQFWIAPETGVVPLPPRLFLVDRAYEIELRQTRSGSQESRTLALRPADLPLVDIKTAGDFLDYAILHGSNRCLSVLVGPAGPKRMPAGGYCYVSGRLKLAGAEALRAFDLQPLVEVTQGTRLLLGGPLTNSVEMTRHGRALVLSYRLVGVDGRNYSLANLDRTKPPEFALYRGSKRIVSGKFEYG